jgi:hypothetical protein
MAARQYTPLKKRRPPPPDRKFEKRRCKYCNALFDLTKPNKLFCTDRHRIAWNNQGAALGPLAMRLPKYISKEVKRQLEALDIPKMIADMRASIVDDLSDGTISTPARFDRSPG